MSRADRLFDIIQALRVAKAPVTARALAERLEVTVRTVYRDMAVLQARRVPIEGAAGIGYVLRRGFDLPPLMFTVDEVDAIAVGAGLVRRLRDPVLLEAAERVLAKVSAVLPEARRSGIVSAPFYVSDGSAALPTGVNLAELRRAIREERKVRMTYADVEGRRTERTVWPIAMAYYVDATVLGAWCELRGDYRDFRVERVLSSTVLDDTFPAGRGALAEGWFAQQTTRTRST